jgi:hypothetical protein
VLVGVAVVLVVGIVAEGRDAAPQEAAAAQNTEVAGPQLVPAGKLRRAAGLYHRERVRADRLARILRHREQYRATLVLAGLTYPRANTRLADRIMRCEAGSGGATADSRHEPHAGAANPTSSAGGRAQYLASTWAATPEGRAGLSRFDPVAGVFAIVRHLANSGNDTSPWTASRPCWG